MNASTLEKVREIEEATGAHVDLGMDQEDVERLGEQVKEMRQATPEEKSAEQDAHDRLSEEERQARAIRERLRESRNVEQFSRLCPVCGKGQVFFHPNPPKYLGCPYCHNRSLMVRWRVLSKLEALEVYRSTQAADPRMERELRLLQEQMAALTKEEGKEKFAQEQMVINGQPHDVITASGEEHAE